MIHGDVLVRVGEDNNLESGGGPLQRSDTALYPANETVMVYRTAEPVVYNPESGWARDPYFDTPRKFLPDGRLVDAGALGATSTSTGILPYAAGAAVGSVAVGLLASWAFKKRKRRRR